jgi:hypothetical protein
MNGCHPLTPPSHPLHVHCTTCSSLTVLHLYRDCTKFNVSGGGGPDENWIQYAMLPEFYYFVHPLPP